MGRQELSQECLPASPSLAVETAEVRRSLRRGIVSRRQMLGGSLAIAPVVLTLSASPSQARTSNMSAFSSTGPLHGGTGQQSKQRK